MVTEESHLPWIRVELSNTWWKNSTKLWAWQWTTDAKTKYAWKLSTCSIHCWLVFNHVSVSVYNRCVMSYVNLCNINASFPNPQSRSYCNIQISHNQQVFPRCFEVFFLCSSFGSLTLSYILSCNIQSQADLWPPHSSTVFTVTRMFCYLFVFFAEVIVH